MRSPAMHKQKQLSADAILRGLFSCIEVELNKEVSGLTSITYDSIMFQKKSGKTWIHLQFNFKRKD